MPLAGALWLISGLAYGLAFPKFNLTCLVWVALIPALWTAVRSGQSNRQTFVGGWGAGLIANLLIYVWLWPTFIAARIDGPTTLLCWTALSAVLAVYFGLFVLFYRALPNPSMRVLLGATGWVALDEIRSVILSGFPWALLSHSQVFNTSLIQLASVTGAAGITFLIVLVNAAFFEAMHASRNARRVTGFGPLIGAIALTLGVLAWGHHRLSAAATLPVRTLKVSLLQGNIDQYRKWDDAYEADIRGSYERLARTAAAKKPDLILWPESSVPADIPNDAVYVQWLVKIASETATPHLFGSLSSHGRQELNSAFVMRANGELEGQYSKRHLVPFGEYVPFPIVLTSLVPYLGQVGTFEPGKSAKIFEVNGIKLSPNICYEAMFPGLVRESARGADVIVNLTNDGWFLDSSGPHQDYAVNILRAVENGRPVLRAANTGISAIIDAFGRVLLESPLMVEGEFSGTVPVPPLDFRTLYGEGHNWFGWLCGGIFALALVRVLRKKP